jgi:fumarate reductase iron-sulfur subunit
VGAAGLLRIARFLTDPRDQRSTGQLFEVIGTDDGVFGCIGFLACQDWCPKELPLATQISYLRRKLALSSLKSRDSVAVLAKG